MLAERKQKVIYSNPRGTLWANDKQKFGQRMLESMGWQEGQGLGKDQTGITESIKPSFKFDNKGFGYKSKSNDWIEDNNVYEQILSDLSKYHKQRTLIQKGNKMKSKILRRRPNPVIVYSNYKKFLRAKNLSIKSEQDLYCIFPTKDKQKTNSNHSDDEKPTMIKSQLSIRDYLEQKMKRKSKSIKIIANFNESNDVDDDDDDDEHTICLRSDHCDNDSLKKRKMMKITSYEQHYNNDDPLCLAENDDDDDDYKAKNLTKKRRKKN
ncbi:PIN2/TERF1-interacting telomerase inhibitor 1 [Dermatophagoides pteronyssinus]|uniref:PIN2/TERF1-interacting telomerase inhibitor 1 n=1 Tax=Dermatophagoides pteronyssinus TaxID=6956 RepID=A0ABQ8J9C6_DERPT|nr:PIN2/TERF1-interacting telomerase inhibitor 1 [Dermatophagoides pteronyssinus]